MNSSARSPSQALIDVHHHAVPPFYLAENRDRIAGSRGGEISRPWLEWTPERSLSAMDAHDVATAVLSLTSPGVWFGDREAARQTARRFNEYVAGLVRNHPGRFGLFAAIPLPDREGSLSEIEYALDVLKADGIGLLTSYDDKWLGEPVFGPVFEELNHRKATVFIHPTAPAACRALMPGIAAPMLEVLQDTARAIVSLLFSGAFSRFRDIRFIFCHAGGTLPALAGRIAQYASPDVIARLPNGAEHELKRLYYDIAASAYKPAVAALRALVPATQILFGSDHPYRQISETTDPMRTLGFSASELAAIGRDNALALPPRLGAA